MGRIKNESDLRSVLDEAEIEMAQQLLDHDCWVVWQRWKADPPDTEPELHGPYGSATEAMGERDKLHAEGMRAEGWIASHGEPVTLVVPVWKPGE